VGLWRLHINEVNNYAFGQNRIVDGGKESKIDYNQAGDIIKVTLSNSFYTAKGYFDKMITNLNDLKLPNSETEEIRKDLIKAAKTKIDAIDLYIEGMYLKERIGKAIMNNAGKDIFVGSSGLLQSAPKRRIAVPEYHGEVEKGVGMVLIADSYFVDGLRKMKAMLDKTNSIGFDDSQLASIIGNYSDATESEFPQYVETADSSLAAGDYFEAIIAYSRALKVHSGHHAKKQIHIGLIKSYLGIGDKLNAKKQIENATDLFPGDDEIKALNTD